jgi:CheY-like chemotaxis protein
MSADSPAVPHILYAEDDPIQRKLFTRVLLDAGYDVTPVENGARAWAALQGSGFDLLLTDENMPHLSGSGLLTLARQSGFMCPAILASANAGTAGQDQGTDFVARLQKPLTRDRLLSAIESAQGA